MNRIQILALLITAISPLACFASGPDGYTDEFQLVSTLQENISVSITNDTLRCYPPTENVPFTRGFLFVDKVGASTGRLLLQTDPIDDCKLIELVAARAGKKGNKLQGKIRRELYKVTRTYDGGDVEVFEKCEIELGLEAGHLPIPHFITQANYGPYDPLSCYSTSK